MVSGAAAACLASRAFNLSWRSWVWVRGAAAGAGVAVAAKSALYLAINYCSGVSFGAVRAAI